MFVVSKLDIQSWASGNANCDPRDILAFALKHFSPHIGISFSGAEDVVLVDLAVHLGASFRVFSIDTERLHPETYQYLERVREHYGIPIELFFPRPEDVEKLVR